MRTLLIIIPALVLVTACGPDTSTPEGVMERSIEIMEELVETLEGVKDKADAEAARSKLESLKKEQEELQKAAKNLKKDMSPEDAAELGKKYQKKLTDLAQRLQKAYMGMSPEARKVLDSAMR